MIASDFCGIAALISFYRTSSKTSLASCTNFQLMFCARLRQALAQGGVGARVARRASGRRAQAPAARRRGEVAHVCARNWASAREWIKGRRRWRSSLLKCYIECEEGEFGWSSGTSARLSWRMLVSLQYYRQLRYKHLQAEILHNNPISSRQLMKDGKDEIGKIKELMR